MVSIIVPVYNAEKYLSDCVQSILRQTYGNIECILVDDGSTDGSAALCSHLAAEDTRIVYYHQKNAGVAAARNRGLSLARGDRILFVDSDDILQVNMVEEMLSAMDADETDCVVCGITFFTASVEQRTQEVPFPAVLRGGEEMAVYFAANYSATLMNSPCNKLYKKEYIQQNFDPIMDLGEDLLFNLAYFRAISSISYLDESFYYYRRNVSGSLSVKLRPNMYEIAKRLYKECMAYLNEYKGPFQTEKISYFHFKNLQLATLGVLQASSPKREKKEKLCKICNDSATKVALADVAHMPLGKKDRVFHRLMDRKNVFLLYRINKLWLIRRGDKA